MTSNHFLLIILYFISNFFIFIAEASANSDQEVKLKFFEDQCQSGCEFTACYQKLSTADRDGIMNELVKGKYIQKLQSQATGTSAYIYGSEKYSVPVAKAKFNETVSSRCNAISQAAQNKEAQAVANSASKDSKSASGKSGGGGGDSGSLIDAAKQMAPLVAATPIGKDVIKAAKDKGKEVYSNVKNAVTGKTPIPDATVGSGQVAAPKNSGVPAANPGQTAAPTVREGGGIQAQNGEIGSNMGRGTKSEIKTAVEAKAPASTQTVDSNKPASAEVQAEAKSEALKEAKKIEPASPEAAQKGKDIAEEKEATKTDPEAQTKMTEAKTLANEFKKNTDAMIQELKDIPPPVSEFSQSGCRAELTQLQSAADKYATTKETCSADTARATNLCSTVRSPQALKTQQVLSAGTALLSKASAASESCGIMGSISTIANAGMLSAQAICSGMKIKCEMSCAAGLAEAEKIVNEDVAKLEKCHQAHTEIAEALNNQSNYYYKIDQPSIGAEKNNLSVRNTEYVGLIKQGVTKLEMNFNKEKEESASIPMSTVECKKNEIDIMTMGAQAAALFSAAMDSKKCEEQLSSGGGGGNGKPIATTAQFCAQAANASSITCRCAANPSGAGCLGALGSGSDVSGFAGLQKGGSNVSGFASAAGPKISDSDIKFGDLPSDIAKKPNDGLAATSPFGAASAGGSGGGGGGSSAAPSNSGDGSGAGGEEKSKFAMGISSLAKGFGNLFGGGAKPAAKSLSKQQQEVQLNAIKRKLASDQVRAEISTASGKSNFDKIRTRYTETRSSLIATP